MRVVHLTGGVLTGALAIKFMPTPFIVVGVFMALSYAVVRLLVWAVRWAVATLSLMKLRFPDLPSFDARRRMEQVMALADERICGLIEELAAAQVRVRDLETEREGLDHFRQKADARIAELERELTAAKTALEVAGQELRRRPHEPDPLYRRVGLDRDCPDFVLKAARRAYRVTLHEDKHPPEHKRVAHEKLVAAEQVFDTLFQRRGLRA